MTFSWDFHNFAVHSVCIILALGCPLVDLKIASKEAVSAVEYCFLLPLDGLVSLLPFLVNGLRLFFPEREKKSKREIL